MKKTKTLAVPILLLSIWGWSPRAVLGGAPGRDLLPAAQRTTLVSLENLEAEYYSANKIVAIKGKIKNISSITMRGYITLYLLSASGSVLSSFDMPLNDNRPFRGGQSVDFDTAVNVGTIGGAYRVSVEFTRE